MTGKTLCTALIVLSLAVLVACSEHRNGHRMERRLLGVDEWGGKALARKLHFFGIRVTVTKGGSAPADGGDEEEEEEEPEGGDEPEGEGEGDAPAEDGDRRK